MSEPAPVFEYNKTKEQLDILLSDWESTVNTGGIAVSDTATTQGASSEQYKGENNLARIRRDLRRDVRDLPTMRSRGEISVTDNYLPRRIIDQEISKEKPAQIAFIEQPDRLLIFKDLTDNSGPTDDLEYEFTNHMRYPGWTIPWHRAFDSVDLHGGCCLEVRPDPSKPLKCAIEYIRREDLIFAVESNDIQSNEFILRKYLYMPFELEGFVKSYGFNPAAVKELVDTASSTSKRHQRVTVYKCFAKRDGIVYIFWYAKESRSRFLKDPEPLDLGIRDPQEIESYVQTRALYTDAQTLASQTNPALMQTVQQFINPPELPASLPVAEYPIFFLPYEVIEDDRLLASKGLAFRYRSDQEAATELWTGFINALNKAKDIYASYANNTLNPTGINPTDKLVPNTIMGKEAKFWSLPYPPPEYLMGIQAFETSVAQRGNSVDFAVTNRASDRKTAAEIQAASMQATATKSVGISGQSLTILAVYSLCWDIGRSYILLGEVPTFNVTKDRLMHRYVLAAAGDSDVLRRDGKKQVIRETFQYVQGTPIGNKFLEYLVNTFFPEQARAWIPILQSEDPAQLIAAALQVLTAMPREDLTEVQNAQLGQLIGLLQGYLAKRSSGGGIPAGPAGMAEPPNNEIANNRPKEEVGSASGASDGASTN